MMKQKVLEKFKVIFENLEARGCSKEEILSFIDSNFDLIQKEYETITERLYLIYNNKALYGVLFVDGDEYQWSIYRNNEKFMPLVRVGGRDNNGLQNGDYIVEMMLNFADTEKVKQVVPNVSEMDVENKVKILKRIGLNSKGYHFR